MKKNRLIQPCIAIRHPRVMSIYRVIWVKVDETKEKQKTCRKFYSNGISIITTSWNFIWYPENSEKNHMRHSKSLSKLDFPF